MKHLPKYNYRAVVITLSDKGSRGQREDKSGLAIETILTAEGYTVAEKIILPDEPEELKQELVRICDGDIADLVLTTGGTGLAVRDTTPEATLAVGDRVVPGISEAMRAYSMTITKRAMLSRGVSVIRKRTLIVNLPGSPKAVKESLEYIISELFHGIQILRGDTSECGRK